MVSNCQFVIVAVWLLKVLRHICWWFIIGCDAQGTHCHYEGVYFVNAYKFILIFSLYSCFLSTSCIPLVRFEENIAYIKLAHTKHPSVRWKRKKNKKAGMSTSALHEVCVIPEVEASWDWNMKTRDYFS